MENVNITQLKNHPLNTYFFDDLAGQKWEEFKQSIATSGVIEPVVCTKGMTIISGHQRVRACRELNIEMVMCDIRNLDDKVDEAEILKQLIETNIRQRGNINCSAMQMSRIIEALEPFYGIRHGNNQHSEDMTICHIPKTQEQLAAELGIDWRTYHRYKQLGELIPEFQAMVEEETISYTTASSLVARLSPADQKALSDVLPPGEKVTAAIAKRYIGMVEMTEREAAKKDTEIEKLKARVEELVNLDLEKEKKIDEVDERQEQRIHELEEQLAEAKSKSDEELIRKNTELIAKERQQYERAEQLRKEAAQRQEAYEKLMRQLEKHANTDEEINEMSAEIRELEDALSTKESENAELRKKLENGDIINVQSPTQTQTQTQQSEFTIYRLQDIAVNISGECFSYASLADDEYMGDNVPIEDLLAAKAKIQKAIESLEGLCQRIAERVEAVAEKNKKDEVA